MQAYTDRHIGIQIYAEDHVYKNWEYEYAIFLPLFSHKIFQTKIYPEEQLN
jgi:hypothetical protein